MLCKNVSENNISNGGKTDEIIKRKISITLDNDIIEVLKNLAEEDDRSLSQYINLILKRYLKDIKKQENRKS